MKPHQQRVVEEQKELSEKLSKLLIFIAQSPVYAALPDNEKERLNRQSKYMALYSDVLVERIKAF